MDAIVEAKDHRTWSTSWNVGEALWWRDEQGIHGVVLTAQPELGPKGGRQYPGTLTELCAPTKAALNEALDNLGFGPLEMPVDEIAWHGKGVR